MPTNVIMPQMGESIFEGTITRWLKKPGETVQRDEALFEISTDKVDAEIPSTAAGVLSRVLVPEGETVQINTVVAEIEEAGAVAAEPAKAEAAEPVSEPAKAAPPPPAPPAAAPPSAPPAAFEREPVVEMPRRPQQPAEAAEVRSSPLVRRMAAEHGVDLSQLSGSGLGGRITKADILAYIEAGKGGVAPAPSAPPSPAAAPTSARPAAPGTPGARVGVVPMSAMRQKIAQHMVESKRTSPHVHTVFDVDMSRVARLRARTKAEFEQRNGVRLTYLPFIARAAVTALKAFPYVNSSLEGTNIVLKKEINLGIAVVLEWGLIVPVIKNAEEKNFLGLAKAIRDLADRARAKKLSPDEVQNGTFTITNPGQGALFGTPIISQPQVAILGVGHIHKTPVVIDDAIAIRSIVYLSLGYDHRVVDGVLADQFMAYVKKTLESWEEPVL